MYFLIIDGELLEKCKKVSKVSNSMEKEFDSEPLCNQKYLKTKVKCYEWKVSTNAHNNKLTKEGPECICLLIDSVFRSVKSYYPLVILEECKYIAKEKKIFGHITSDFQ